MPESQTEKIAWRVIGKSVQGASHKRSGKPNQDAIQWFPESEDGVPVILAIADGHGSEKCFRSDIGSVLAVENTVHVLKKFFESTKDASNAARAKELAYARLPKVLERKWKEAADEHLRNNPISSGMAGEPPIAETPEKPLDPYRFLPYGSTLLAALIAEDYILYLQLGDGDVLTISPDGEVSQPMPQDERLIANETTSLCLPNASDHFRISFQVLSEGAPALIMLSTDGYSNSFKSSQDFFKAGTDILQMVRSDGLDWVNRNLGKWLEETSQQGSGDDISVGLIENLNVRGIDSLLWQNKKYANRMKALESRVQGMEGTALEISAQNEELRNSVLKLQSKLQWSLVAILILLLVCGGLAVGTMFSFDRQVKAIRQIQSEMKPTGNVLSRPPLTDAVTGGGSDAVENPPKVRKGINAPSVSD